MPCSGPSITSHYFRLTRSRRLAAIPEADRDARFYVRRAALQIAAGQLGAARSDLDQALSLDPSNSDVYMLRTVVAVALNDKQGALDNGRQAVTRARESPATALIAQSYALQANFMEAARSAMEEALASKRTAGRRGPGSRNCA